MRAYELMIIFDGDVEDTGVTEGLARVTQLVEAGDGRVATTDLWGRRRFAYEINHKFEGIYVVLEIVTEAANLDDVERSLRLADEVVRHKLIRLPDREAAQRGLFGDATPVEAATAAPES
jgi:small subunit ribosomal protein S6